MENKCCRCGKEIDEKLGVYNMVIGREEEFTDGRIGYRKVYQAIPICRDCKEKAVECLNNFMKDEKDE